MKLIDISTPKHPNTFTMVDDGDYEWLNQWNWYVHFSRGMASPCRHSGKKPHRTTIKMHQVIMKPPGGFVVDHINRDSLDNRRANLRICTPMQNMKNRKHTHSESGFKGVGRHASGLWRVRIAHDKKVYSLGHFIDPIQAAKAYDAAAIKLHGEFASLNFQESR